jgi:predicted transposase YbfD/YdcC
MPAADAYAAFTACFADLDDPRADNIRHLLHEILLIAFCAVLCGAEDPCDMALFGRAKEDYFRQFLRLPHGIPSHDTFSRLFRLLDPARFQACFLQFMQRFAENLAGVVALDGKTLRRSFDRASAQSPLHLVSAWAAEQRLVLGQVAVDDKSNEITAVPPLLALLSLKGAIVTVDAMHCQRATAAQIVEQKGDYVLALKANQESLHDDVRHLLDESPSLPITTHTTVEKEHGRIETRTSVVSTEMGWLQEQHQWPGLAAIGKITRTREIGASTSTETTYYLLSTPLSAERFGHVVRQHWGIENQLHWVLDVTMNEDQARQRRDHGPENLALLRRLALNVARLEPSKGSMKGKRKRAGWDNAYLTRLLAQLASPHMR